MDRKKKVQFSSDSDDKESARNEFSTTNLGFTPTLNRNPIYKVPEERSAECVAPSSSISRPNYEGTTILSLLAILEKV